MIFYMSGNVRHINKGKRSRISNLQKGRIEAAEAKRAKLLEVLNPITPESTVQLEPQLMCMSCSSKDS